MAGSKKVKKYLERKSEKKNKEGAGDKRGTELQPTGLNIATHEFRHGNEEISFSLVSRRYVGTDAAEKTVAIESSQWKEVDVCGIWLDGDDIKRRCHRIRWAEIVSIGIATRC